MPSRASSFLIRLVLPVILFLPTSARAWVETAVRGHEVRVEVAADGKSVIRHELLLKIRGGPMKSLEVAGIGTDIEPLPDAIVKRAVEGSHGAWPLTVSSMEGGSLRLGIGADRGIRGGSYLFQFAYSMDLRETSRIAPLGDGTEITFVGPRLSSGVDSAKVTFSVPRGSRPPRLVEFEQGAANVLLGEIRRGPERDEIELVRAHLATGEPAVWKIDVAADALSGVRLAPGGPMGDAEHGLLASRPPPAQGFFGASSDPWRWWLAGVLALFFGALVFLKATVTRTAARIRDAQIKPLIPGPPLLRASFSSLSTFAAIYFALIQQPIAAIAALTPAIFLSTHLLPVRIVRPRGPGVWEPVPGDIVGRAPALPGRMFETRTLPGFALFATLAGAIFFAAYRLLPVSNYLALMTMGLMTLLVPLFWTGRPRDLPQSPLEQARPWLGLLQRALDPQIASVELWARRAALPSSSMQDEVGAAAGHDEARLRIVLTSVPGGLRAFEVSFDEAAGACVLPCVVLRVLEDSPTLRRLPPDIAWQRGRTSEERVALLRPSAPTRAQLLRLVRSLLSNLRAVGHQSSSSGPHLRGTSELASKAGTPAAAPAM